MDSGQLELGYEVELYVRVWVVYESSKQKM